MLVVLLIVFFVLLLASILLLVDAFRGQLEEHDGRWRIVRGSLYLLASISGAALLITLADGEWLFALALAPVTFLSLLRFSMIARGWWEGWRLPLYTCTIVAVGIIAVLQTIPYPLNRDYVIERLNLMDTSLDRPDTIDPEAVRPVRA